MHIRISRTHTAAGLQVPLLVFSFVYNRQSSTRRAARVEEENDERLTGMRALFFVQLIAGIFVESSLLCGPLRMLLTQFFLSVLRKASGVIRMIERSRAEIFHCTGLRENYYVIYKK